MRVRFDPFTVDTDTRQLMRGASEVHLSPKAFDLLWSLIEYRPRVVEKTELHTRIWPDTYVVDANLNVLIGEIRRALGDSSRQPRYIRTVHGVGYAFCGNVDSVKDGPVVAAARQTACWVVAKDRTVRLVEGENIVGRDPECSVWLDSDSVSRRHARIVVDSADRRLLLDDLGSKNGTRLRGVRVRERVELSDGDELVFGAVRVKLRSWTSATGAETKRITRPKR
ncbi:MAG: winged helix-turn-helix domain-containing protein [Acidobacteria bacterium]|nr:winged helix-turn-helix domain-containing protein [Acidobacteriota bacterium]MCA1649006.1 winged helix-turn-helix domain-containing protein [Acidobacteriota bacterium]